MSPASTERNIEGILVWETTYWNSPAAYPDANQPQNPDTDPMSWTSGYSNVIKLRRPLKSCDESCALARQ